MRVAVKGRMEQEQEILKIRGWENEMGEGD
jgi:hypothetical protein